MRFLKKHPLVIIFILGFVIRLFFIFGNYTFDVNNHIAWAKDLHQRGFSNFFFKQSSEIFAVKLPNYPPLSLFLFYFFYPLPKIIFNIFWFLNVNIPFFPSKIISLIEGIDKRLFLAAMLKLPAILSDLGLALITVFFVNRLAPKKKELKLLIPALVLFNPVFIYNSSIWGQIDVIPLFFVITSIYLLLFTNKNIWSGVFFVLSLLVKPTTLLFIPVYGLFFIKKFGIKKLIITLLICNLVFWLSFLPFLKEVNFLIPYSIYWQKIISAQSLPYATNGAFNFWLMLVNLKNAVLDTSPFIFNLPYRFWGYLLTGFFISIILIRLLKIKIKEESIFLGLFLSSLGAVIFLTKMHERYFLLPLPFLLLLVIKNKKYLKYYCLLSVLVLLNHYHSWAVPYIPVIFKTIDTPFVYKAVSLLNIIVFLSFFNKQRL